MLCIKIGLGFLSPSFLAYFIRKKKRRKFVADVIPLKDTPKPQRPISYKQYASQVVATLLFEIIHGFGKIYENQTLPP
jgi:hypothetical protein